MEEHFKRFTTGVSNFSYPASTADYQPPKAKKDFTKINDSFANPEPSKFFSGFAGLKTWFK